MIDGEPKIQVALLQNATDSRFFLQGAFFLPDGKAVSGDVVARAQDGRILLADADGREILQKRSIELSPAPFADACFTVYQVVIGIDFHWQQLQKQTFRGSLILTLSGKTTFHVINHIGLEDYLASVISSEMAASAPPEFLKAQAITARSWLLAMLARKKEPRDTQVQNDGEVSVWQDVNDHEGFDVCADDHCQRYQGITRIVSENAAQAMAETRGIFLISDNEICDARYYKCCGGRTDIFSTAWENKSFPYLQSVVDGPSPQMPIKTEKDAELWLAGVPPAYCNTKDPALLARILPAFDQKTVNFYRWQVSYTRQELEDLLKRKSGHDFGNLEHILPLERGPSGRISQLKIVGTKKTVTVGKELEIRRWLSETHLYSSAFIVVVEHDPQGAVQKFTFHGGGWGHGVGLCQIGAAVMADQGFQAQDILAHYFPGAELRKLY